MEIVLDALPTGMQQLRRIILTRRPTLAPGGTLPAMSLSLARTALAAERVAAYRALHAVPEGAPTPLTILYLIAQPAHLALLVDEHWPLSPLGVVHVANTIAREGHVDPVRDLRVGVRLLEQRWAKRGMEFVLETTLAQSSGTATMTSTYLNPMRGIEVPSSPSATTTAERKTPPAAGSALRASAAFALGANAGRVYAQISGDWNPIHLHPLTARPFGFRRPIAHGMRMAAHGEVAASAILGRAVQRTTVRFRRPVSLPSVATMLVTSAPNGAAWTLEADAERCAVGTVE
jgi:acyl dehydratase